MNSASLILPIRFPRPSITSLTLPFVSQSRSMREDMKAIKLNRENVKKYRGYRAIGIALNVSHTTVIRWQKKVM